MSERRAGIGLRTRLLGLVLIPVVLLGALTWSTAAQRRAQADAASDVRSLVADLTRLVDLSSTLLLARTPVEVEVRARELGLDPGDALALLDLDPEQLGDLDDVADAVRAVPAGERPFEAARVEDLARRVATVRVLHEVDGQRKVVSHFNKATKGRLVRALLEDGGNPRTPTALADLLGELGWSVEIGQPGKAGTQLDVIVSEL